MPLLILKRDRHIKEILTYYSILEEYFMMESSKKVNMVMFSRDSYTEAIKLDQLEDGNLTSSMVDNTFFVLKQCSFRALSTINSNTACTISSMLSNILSYDYKAVLENMLSESFEGSSELNPKVMKTVMH